VVLRRVNDEFTGVVAAEVETENQKPNQKQKPEPKPKKKQRRMMQMQMQMQSERSFNVFKTLMLYQMRLETKLSGVLLDELAALHFPRH
jgi:hypothetical protein